MLQVQDGIRLRDLAKALEAFCKLSLDVDSLVFHGLSWSRQDLERFDRCRAHVVGAHVFCVKGEVEGASDGLFARVMGVIRRRTKIGGAEG